MGTSEGKTSLARRLVLLVCLYAAGAAAGWLCLIAGVPLPWMVGALLVSAILAATRGGLSIPLWNRWAGQLVIASAVALNMTSEALSAMAENVVPMVISAVLIIGFSLVLASIIVRSSGVDRATALFASLPGGPVEMASLAEQYGGRAGLVAFSQTLRIAAIVILIPPFLIMLGAHFEDISTRTGPLDTPGLVLVLATALLTSVALWRLGIANPFFLGPLAGVGLATLLGAPVGAIPGPLIAAAQVALGISLGAMFDRSIIRSAGSFAIHGALISAILIALACVLAAIYAAVLRQPYELLVLANVPGSITEMALTAKGMSLDASFVTAYHVVRIFIIIPSAEVIFRGYVRLADWLAPLPRGG
jgi:membrane AbrB-like protein